MDSYQELRRWEQSHNPYFNRWFSAIRMGSIRPRGHRPVTILILIDGFLQSKKLIVTLLLGISHNPYFNRWFSAIYPDAENIYNVGVTILILIDGFLQSYYCPLDIKEFIVTILILIDGFLQFII